MGPPQLNTCFYCVLDLETTGFSRSHNHIIEVATKVLKQDGVLLNKESFESLIWPPSNILSFIGTLTGITDEILKGSEYLVSVMSNFFKFIINQVDEVEEVDGRAIDCVVFFVIMV